VHYFMQSDVAAARLMVRLRARGYDVAVTSAARGHVAYRPTQCPSLRP
jgi:hypothetical protein